jgi:membrane associated rhomboid family serine protease
MRQSKILRALTSSRCRRFRQFSEKMTVNRARVLVAIFWSLTVYHGRGRNYPPCWGVDSLSVGRPVSTGSIGPPWSSCRPQARIRSKNSFPTSKESLTTPFRSLVLQPRRVGSHLAVSSEAEHWEGDDIRWIRKLQRRFLGSGGRLGQQPIRTLLLLANVLVYTYQVVSTVQFIWQNYPLDHGLADLVRILVDVLLGRTVVSPFTKQWSMLLSPSRLRRGATRYACYLTSGFLHGNLLHLALNMDALRRIPSWMERGLGAALFLTAYLVGIVSGNLATMHYFRNNLSVTTSAASMLYPTLSLGASGGICGLYGLQLISLLRMKNNSAAQALLKSLGLLLLYGMVLENVSNVAHVGGLVGGMLVGLLLGPRYRSNYNARRKWSLDSDDPDVIPRSYRHVMGFGISPVPRKAGRWIVVSAVAAAAMLLATIWR